MAIQAVIDFETTRLSTDQGERLLNLLEKQLIGPAPTFEKSLPSSPLQCYTTGILFSIVLDQQAMDLVEADNDCNLSVSADQGLRCLPCSGESVCSS